MLKKAVPYYPVLMRPAQRMNHHLIQASKQSHVQAAICSYGNWVKHYGK